MITSKTAEEIELLAEGGAILARIMQDLAAQCVPGASAASLNEYAESEIEKCGGTPAFKGYGPKGQEFPATLCISPNDMLVHGIPYKELVFKDGDVVGIDIGMKYKNLFTDHALTVGVGSVDVEVKRLLSVTKECLALAIAEAVVGNHLGDIGAAVQQYAEERGYGVVRQLTGHGVGYAVHEDPQIPNYGERGVGEKITEGAVLAIEPMINMGTHKVTTASDGWGVVTEDGKMSAHFEHTVAVTKDGPRILTIV